MQDLRVEKPVDVALGRSRNTIYTVDRVAQAADILLNRWLAIAGKKHVAVRKACLGVLEGLKETRDARKAFVEAAKEADTLRALGERDDIIKHMHRSLVGHGIDRPVAGYVLAAEEIDTPVIGRLLQRAHPNRRHYAVCARPMD